MATKIAGRLRIQFYVLQNDRVRDAHVPQYSGPLSAELLTGVVSTHWLRIVCYHITSGYSIYCKYDELLRIDLLAPPWMAYYFHVAFFDK